MKRLIHVLILFAGFLTAFTIASANNISVSNVSITGQNTGSKYSLIKFDISWENSWRTSSGPSNWDAAWIFVKYRVNGGDGVWRHASLDETGFVGAVGSTVKIGLLSPGSAYDAATNPGLGAFVYRDADGSGTNTFANIQLKWNYGVNSVADDATIDLQVFGVEMVYVPQGVFSLGTGGTESGAFYTHPTTANPYTVSSENAISVGGTNGFLNYAVAGVSGDQSGPIPASYPKGYSAFYCMKYEITQQQYVDFLNNLTQDQATARKFSPATSIYGLALANAERYAITGDAIGSYATSNPYIPCNWLSWADIAAYLDWSGMRPMTELEFEKACRGTEAPVSNEYAWGTTTITGSAYTISNSGLATEVITGGYNGTSGNVTNTATVGDPGGPLRVGIFAGSTGNTGRVTAGATFYGIMEMSGSLFERPVSVGNALGRAFTGTHGNGILDGTGNANVTSWPGTDADGIGYRGGSYSSFVNNTKLQVSDRFYAAYTHANRDELRNGQGGRGVRIAPAP